jgi:hypothetical protein
MAYLHKFQEHPFPNGFWTQDSILKTDQFNPEVIFIGTYNHGWNWNLSDFYYGRGMYMWTILGNLFLYGNNNLIMARNIKQNHPTFDQLFEICEKGNIVFADIVKGLHDDLNIIEQPQNSSVVVNGYSWRSYKDGPLDFMGAKGWLADNVKAIIKYINETPSIKHVYFTFKSGKWVVQKLNEIRNLIRPDVTCCSIFTPTGNGFGVNLQRPFQERSWGLAHCWVWNGLKHNIPVNRPNYGHLDHHWLIDKGVNPMNF